MEPPKVNLSYATMLTFDEFLIKSVIRCTRRISAWKTQQKNDNTTSNNESNKRSDHKKCEKIKSNCVLLFKEGQKYLVFLKAKSEQEVKSKWAKAKQKYASYKYELK